MSRYGQCSDEELIERLRNGESKISDYLMEKYKGTVKKRARAMYLIGGETDDLIQEGMIGLFKAVQDYRPDVFSYLCRAVHRQTAVQCCKKFYQAEAYSSEFLCVSQRRGGKRKSGRPVVRKSGGSGDRQGNYRDSGKRDQQGFKPHGK